MVLLKNRKGNIARKINTNLIKVPWTIFEGERSPKHYIAHCNSSMYSIVLSTPDVKLHTSSFTALKLILMIDWFLTMFIVKTTWKIICTFPSLTMRLPNTNKQAAYTFSPSVCKSALVRSELNKTNLCSIKQSVIIDDTNTIAGTFTRFWSVVNPFSTRFVKHGKTTVFGPRCPY